jgi:hypothetical protein
MSRRFIYDKMSSEEFRAYLENTGYYGWQDGYKFALRGKQTPSPTQGICAMLVAHHPEVIPTLAAFFDARAVEKE